MRFGVEDVDGVRFWVRVCIVDGIGVRVRIVLGLGMGLGVEVDMSWELKIGVVFGVVKYAG